MQDTITISGLPANFRIASERCAPTDDNDEVEGFYVAVVSESRDEVDSPEAKLAAIKHVAKTKGYAGVIHKTQGPLADNGDVKPFKPGPHSPPSEGMASVGQYLQMAAEQNLNKKHAKSGGGWVAFHLVARQDLV